jgi:hypothetical protein
MLYHFSQLHLTLEPNQPVLERRRNVHASIVVPHSTRMQRSPARCSCQMRLLNEPSSIALIVTLEVTNRNWAVFPQRRVRVRMVDARLGGHDKVFDPDVEDDAV